MKIKSGVMLFHTDEGFEVQEIGSERIYIFSTVPKALRMVSQMLKADPPELISVAAALSGASGPQAPEAIPDELPAWRKELSEHLATIKAKHESRNLRGEDATDHLDPNQPL